jgi:hypothetical protein
MMPALIPTEMDQDVLVLKAQGAPAILASLKTLLKTQKKTLSTHNLQATTDCAQLYAAIDILCQYIKALETPYPSNLVSAGFSYACNPEKYTKAGAHAVHSMKTKIIPDAIGAIQSLVLTDRAQQLICAVLKYLIAIKLGEDEKQDAINKGQASMVNKMAYDVLQKQQPKMDFHCVSELLVTPLIVALREKLSRQRQDAVPTASPTP